MSAPKKFRGYAFTVEDWLAICEMHNHRCASCGEEKPLTVDHIKPRAAGGTDALDNIQPLCRSCNSSKNSLFDGVPHFHGAGAKTANEWHSVGVRLTPEDESYIDAVGVAYGLNDRSAVLRFAVREVARRAKIKVAS